MITFALAVLLGQILFSSFRRVHADPIIIGSNASADISLELINTPFPEVSANKTHTFPRIHAPLNVQNRLRWGTGDAERLLDAYFNEDPWTPSSTEASIVLLGDKRGRHRWTNIQDFPSDSICQYFYPVVKSTTIVNHIVFGSSCPVPQLPPANPHDDTQHVMLNILSPTGTKLLTHLRVYRTPYVDRIPNVYSISTMTLNLNNPQLIEWIKYHLAVGVEHFYIIYNAYDDAPAIDASLVGPFIRDNLVTVIYFPYSIPPKIAHWNNIQYDGYAMVLSKYAAYSQWIGLCDTDEYLVPGDPQYYPKGALKNFIPELFSRIQTTSNLTCMAFYSSFFYCPTEQNTILDCCLREEPFRTYRPKQFLRSATLKRLTAVAIHTCNEEDSFVVPKVWSHFRHLRGYFAKSGSHKKLEEDFTFTKSTSLRSILLSNGTA